MLNQYLSCHGSIFRVLLRDDTGCWLISHENPAAPLYVVAEELASYERIVPPPSSASSSPAALKRLALIQPLLDLGETAIIDKSARIKVSKDIAEAQSTTYRRVLTLFYRYLATGQLISAKPRLPIRNSTYDWAIRKFYYSAKKLSLRGAFEMMLVQKFTDSNGSLMPDAPSWGSFRSYFYRHDFNKNPQKIISRDGLSHYQRNCRPAFGRVSEWRTQPGSFQMDATQADTYLVSTLDRSVIAGRANIYLAVDTFSQLIAGIYVGFNCDDSAVIRCLANAACDKVEFCRQYGIEILPEQWPSLGLPNEIITDRGREFCGTLMDELCRRFGIELLAQPPFRPELKGLVEKSFHLLQEKYKPLLRGSGVIEETAQERWSVDYRTQAKLNLTEFTQVLIHCIVQLNSGRVLPSGKTPAQLWIEAAPKLLDVAPDMLLLMALPRTTVKLIRRGFHVNGIFYIPVKMDGLYINDSYCVAYDPDNLSYVFLADKDWLPCPAAPGQGVEQVSLVEHQALRDSGKAERQAAAQRELASEAECTKAVQQIVSNVTKMGGTS